ncbi:hypothetical protein [Actinokineospora inagensis]|uniref:hypothetical protein n=1 Tax=Actinokineospora inagensis TaxID=103730 RepID=UPI0003FC9E11|nr:hypothetical protein [Actinokineospora inagensis]
MIDLSALPDQPGWSRWLARADEYRQAAEPEVIAQVEQAVRDFPAAAFAAGMLPEPLPVERQDKLPRSEHRETTEGARLRHRVVLEPSDVRGWHLGRGVLISMARTAVRPVFAPVARGESAALRADGTVVRSVIAGWEAYPAPVAVEVDDRVVPLDEYLRRALSEHRR